MIWWCPWLNDKEWTAAVLSLACTQELSAETTEKNVSVWAKPHGCLIRMEGWSPSTSTFAKCPLIHKVRLTELGRQIPNSHLSRLSLLSPSEEWVTFSQLTTDCAPQRALRCLSAWGTSLSLPMKPALILHPSGDRAGWYIPHGSAWPQQFHLWMPLDEPELGTNECENLVNSYPLYTRLTISQWENKQQRCEFSWKSWHTSFRIERSREKTERLPSKFIAIWLFLNNTIG